MHQRLIHRTIFQYCPYQEDDCIRCCSRARKDDADKFFGGLNIVKLSPDEIILLLQQARNETGLLVMSSLTADNIKTELVNNVKRLTDQEVKRDVPQSIRGGIGMVFAERE